VPFKSKTTSKPPTRTSSHSSLTTIAPGGSSTVPEKSPDDSQLLPVQSVDQPPPATPSPPPRVQQSPLPTRDSPLPSTFKPTLFPSLDAAPLPDKIVDTTPVSETQDKQPAVQAAITTSTTFVVEQSTVTSITVSNTTEASNGAPAVPDVEMSWNPSSDEDMATDIDECQALIEDHDDDDIMEVEPTTNDIPVDKVPSPAQSRRSCIDANAPWISTLGWLGLAEVRQSVVDRRNSLGCPAPSLHYCPQRAGVVGYPPHRRG
jgi:hypothetical protein